MEEFSCVCKYVSCGAVRDLVPLVPLGKSNLVGHVVLGHAGLLDLHILEDPTRGPKFPTSRP